MTDKPKPLVEELGEDLDNSAENANNKLPIVVPKVCRQSSLGENDQQFQQLLRKRMADLETKRKNAHNEKFQRRNTAPVGRSSQ